jgi:hypothetical protein
MPFRQCRHCGEIMHWSRQGERWECFSKKHKGYSIGPHLEYEIDSKEICWCEECDLERQSKGKDPYSKDARKQKPR